MVEEKFIKEVTSVLGEKGILLGSEVTERKAGIWIEEPIKSKVILRPRNTEELSKILIVCNKFKQPIVPHGGLTGLVESAITNENEVIISSERMINIEEVDVTGNPTVTVTNSGQGTSTAAHLTCPYASGTGTNELVFTDAGWFAGECLNTNVLYVGADSVSLAGGTIKDKGTNDASTITHTAAIGILQADGITVTAS